MPDTGYPAEVRPCTVHDHITESRDSRYQINNCFFLLSLDDETQLNIRINQSFV